MLDPQDQEKVLPYLNTQDYPFNQMQEWQELPQNVACIKGLMMNMLGLIQVKSF